MSEEITRPLPNDVLQLILTRLDSMDKRLDSIDSNVHSLDARLTAVEEKVDRRMQETRPIWERALAEIAGLRAEMQEGFEKVHGELNHGLRRIDRKVDILNHDIFEARADLRHLDERVTKLEPETP
jgi:chromosome segregation ATPase